MNLDKLNARNAYAVTPDDNNNLPIAAFCLWVGGAGNIKLTTVGGQTVTFSGIPAGTVLNVQTVKIFQTGGTTATLIVALS
jgi:hypothetical protein